MMDVGTIAGVGGAFLAGVVTSLHCSVMCGPLACYLVPDQKSKWSYGAVASVYQVSRILSYTVVGALAGGLGLIALDWITIYQHSLARFLPWALVLFFFLIATRLDSYIPKPIFMSKIAASFRFKAQRLPRLTAAASLGALTPLLPCGPLYAVFTLAFMTQNPLRGAEFLLAFALGTLPLLWLVQAGFARWKAKMSATTISRVQRILAAILCIILGLRLYFFETGQDGLFCLNP